MTYGFLGRIVYNKIADVGSAYMAVVFNNGKLYEKCNDLNNLINTKR